jgi:ribosome maturation protein SDO1
MNTTARIKKQGKHFEVIVGMDEALKFKKDEIPSIQLEIDRVFNDSKKGEVAANSDLEECFGTTDPVKVGKKIIKQGEVLISQEHRDTEQSQKFNQIVEFLVRNSMDPQSGNPHTAARIKNALKEAQVNIKNNPVEEQMPEIVTQISNKLPIKIETKKVKITVPAIHTGKVYGLINQYKEKEKWLNNGDLEVNVAVPSGIIMEFYDKLNSITHGSAITAEIKE